MARGHRQSLDEADGIAFRFGRYTQCLSHSGHEQYPLLLFLSRLRTLPKTISFPDALLSILALGSDRQGLGLAASAENISFSSATEL